MTSTEQTISRLRELRLAHMADAYERQLQQPKLHQLGFDDRIAMLVDHEVAERESRKLKKLMRDASLPEGAMLEDIDFRADRGLDKSQLASLANCDWVRRQQNLIVVGATGVGKTWLACALSSQVCRLKMSAVFYRVTDLYSEIADAHMDGSLAKLKQALIKPNLLILDDLGIGEITPQVAQILLDVVDRRMRTGSLLITSQFSTDKWHELFPDPTVADAILDRIVHQSHRLALKGESMRKIRAKDRMKAQ
jgi:DNA replication protein DnaC